MFKFNKLMMKKAYKNVLGSAPVLNTFYIYLFKEKSLHCHNQANTEFVLFLLVTDGGYDFRYNKTVFHPPERKYSAVSRI